MTTSEDNQSVEGVACPTCGQQFRRERNGFRNPPMPVVFWFCINTECEDGKLNRIYSGG